MSRIKAYALSRKNPQPRPDFHSRGGLSTNQVNYFRLRSFFDPVPRAAPDLSTKKKKKKKLG